MPIRWRRSFDGDANDVDELGWASIEHRNHTAGDHSDVPIVLDLANTGETTAVSGAGVLKFQIDARTSTGPYAHLYGGGAFDTPDQSQIATDATFRTYGEGSSGVYSSVWFKIPELWALPEYGNWSVNIAEYYGGNWPTGLLDLYRIASGTMYLRASHQGSHWSLPDYDVMTQQLPVNEWFNVETFYKLRADSTGEYRVWYNGSPYLTLTERRTVTTLGDASCQPAMLYGVNVETPSPLILYADEIILADERIWTLMGYGGAPTSHPRVARSHGIPGMRNPQFGRSW